MNRIKVLLSGKEYTIQTDESASYVKQLADALNRKIDEFITQNGSGVSVTSACMLVALGLMDDSLKAASDKENLRKQVIDYLEDATRSRTELMELRRQVEELERQNAALRADLAAKGKKGLSHDEEQ